MSLLKILRFAVGRRVAFGVLVFLTLVGTESGRANADLFVSNTFTGNVTHYDEKTGAPLGVFVPTGSGGLQRAAGMAFGADGSLYVSDEVGRQVLRYDGQTGAFQNVFVTQDSGGPLVVQGIVFGPDGNLYASVSFNSSVKRFDGKTGAFLGEFVKSGTGGLASGGDIAFGPDGNLYVGTFSTGKVFRFDGATGAFLNVAADAPGTDGFTFGPDGLLYASTGNQVNRYDPVTGTLLGEFVAAGSGGLLTPADLEFGPDGNLYLISRTNQRVLRYDGTTGAFLDTFVPTGADISSGRFLVFTPSAQVIPEPSSLALLGIGVLALVGYCCRRRRGV